MVEETVQPTRARRPREQWVQWSMRAALLLLAVPFTLAGIISVANNVRNGGVARKAVAAAPVQDRGAEAFAIEFASDAMTYDEKSQDAYRLKVSRYLASDVDPFAGWDGKGKQNAGQPTFVKSEPAPSGVRLYTVAVWVDSGSWINVVVPVAARGGSYVVTAPPTLAAPPQPADWTPSIGRSDVDADLSSARADDVGAFFKAFGDSSPDLIYFQVPGTGLSGLHGRLGGYDHLDKLIVYRGGTTREALATVRWKQKSSGAGRTETYRLRLTQVGGRWLVSSMAPAVTTGGR